MIFSILLSLRKNQNIYLGAILKIQEASGSLLFSNVWNMLKCILTQLRILKGIKIVR